MTGLYNNIGFSIFVPKSGLSLWLYIVGAILVGGLFLLLLTQIPNRLRKPIVIGVTFLAGWFYFLEFMIPGVAGLAPARAGLKSAESNITIAAQALAPHVGDTEKGLKDQSARVDNAKASIDKAVADLNRTSAVLDKQIPIAQANLKHATDEANAFARKHHLNNDQVDRVDGNADDLATQTARKRLNDINGTAESVKSTIAVLTSVRNELNGNSFDSIRKARTILKGAASGIMTARTGISDNFLTPYKEPLGNVSMAVYAFPLGLGIFGLASIHAKNIARKQTGWYNSLAFFLAMGLMAVIAFAQKYAGPGPSKVVIQGVFEKVFFASLTSLQATMFSLVAFYIVSAAYRAFRVRTTESAVMMAAAFIVMLGIVPVGAWITSGLHGNWAMFKLDVLQNWIMTIPNMAAQRGMAFGIGVGALAMAIRVWFSLERGAFFEKEM